MNSRGITQYSQAHQLFLITINSTDTLRTHRRVWLDLLFFFALLTLTALVLTLIAFCVGLLTIPVCSAGITFLAFFIILTQL